MAAPTLCPNGGGKVEGTGGEGQGTREMASSDDEELEIKEMFRGEGKRGGKNGTLLRVTVEGVCCAVRTGNHENEVNDAGVY
ncbi:hypothetical protein GLAREA_07119 [Glarea lozoyensis ATCC 20868]|uniref:Uncharacterized protein n=1 Tax=Glarea lozoyensis (strain ATCC 20868 / MF5171) TaxID=1116229 RepID=S3DPW1_GLAL2|nr:uncharacterized protein GLAREA_07119 [Glarea lozoyensis ATCC 20868]EPE34106.1 hypothetical protein GLAREA_07119 [Glarea lozoyensis ATCC 20868]